MEKARPLLKQDMEKAEPRSQQATDATPAQELSDAERATQSWPSGAT
jgi:hypothetical protein